MDFGQVDTLDGIDFALGPEDPRTAAVLAAGAHRPAAVHVGATGFAMKEWVGKVYPSGTPADGFLAAYGAQFNGIELNATAYRVPEAATVDRWREAVPAGFRFAPKFPQELGMGPDLAAGAPSARGFAERMQGLGDRLGRSLLQLSPSVAPAHVDGLRALLEALPKGFRVAVEFRHRAWFKQRRLVPAAFELLAGLGHAAVITDVAGRRDVSHASLPCPAVCVRFGGNALDPSDFARLDAWAARLGGWLTQGLEEVQFFLHEPGNVLAPEASNALVERLNKVAGLALKPWTPPPAPGRQLSLL